MEGYMKKISIKAVIIFILASTILNNYSIKRSSSKFEQPSVQQKPSDSSFTLCNHRCSIEYTNCLKKSSEEQCLGQMAWCIARCEKHLV